MGQDATSIRAATVGDRHQLANLIHYETHVHRHLDWRPPLEWIGIQPYLVLEQGTRLAAVLACPPDPPEIAWVRLFGVLGGITVKDAWFALWSQARDWLAKQKGVRASAIALQPWFGDLLIKSGFEHTHDVIMLAWEASTHLLLPKAIPYQLRPMTYEDLDAVYDLDKEAFMVEWRNSRNALEIAFMQSALATVVVDEGSLVGYQISTASPLGAHLARLAIRPDLQGLGIGYALVYDLLDVFRRRGVGRVTVNTQSDNLESRALYRKAGFWDTNEVYQVYQILTL
jgi:ribosomal protein S18 acetylase RimI-like enzyme